MVIGTTSLNSCRLGFNLCGANPKASTTTATTTTKVQFRILQAELLLNEKVADWLINRLTNSALQLVNKRGFRHCMSKYQIVAA